MSKKALALLSGGLDSILSALIIKDQGIDVAGISFESLFFSPQVFPIPQISFISQNISKQQLKVVKNPVYGYGKRLNPCLDCHLLMLRQAKQIMKKNNYHFLITGDVLGQRGFSQNKKALYFLDKESDLKGLIVRPLSAKLLRPTIPEQKNWIDRKKLFSIQGKSRKKQLKLAKQYQLKNFSAPGTSCLLTDPHFSARLKKMLNKHPQADKNDIRLLKLGRHFWNKKNLIVVGRNEQENKKIKKLAQTGDIVVDIKNHPSPLALIRTYQRKHGFERQNSTLKKTKKLLKKYAHIQKKLQAEDYLIKNL